MCAGKLTAGLRIDVDTLRGTRLGVPNLLHVLARYRIKATFFFSVGPDNMGRHLRRLLRPAFLLKMMRSQAAGLYGWDILLRGTLWPGPIIGLSCADLIRRTAEGGHEIGLHAWDHHRWQVKVAEMSGNAISLELKKGKEMLERLAGVPVLCSAVPGWRCTDTVLEEKERFDFCYNSDCRGHSLFYPLINGVQLRQPQVPVTLPTYDELIGINNVTRDIYNDNLLSFFNGDRLNVLTIHAEVEGIRCLEMFEEFLKKARCRDIRFRPLKEVLSTSSSPERAQIHRGKTEGREGWLSCQEKTSCQEKSNGNNHDK